jgi:hypothetical protein
MAAKKGKPGKNKAGGEKSATWIVAVSGLIAALVSAFAALLMALK